MKSQTESEIKLHPGVPITKPEFDDSEIDLLRQVLQSGWVVQGPMVAEFERLVAEFVGARFAVATTSCTSALHLSLCALGIGPGDSVLLPSFTFVATANAVEQAGAQPIFIDIDLSSFNIDPNALIHALDRQDSSNANCIIPVSLFGLCPDMGQINTIAKEHELIVVEDAACGLGASRDNHHAGTEAVCGCFSFHPRKAITTGEGGMVLTDDAQIAEKIRKLRNHGASVSDLERHYNEGGSLLPNYDQPGYNYRMTDLQGALGVAQMKKLPSILSRRREAAERYSRLLRPLEFLRPPTAPEGYQHAYQSYVCLYGSDQIDFDADDLPERGLVDQLNHDRNRLMARMESEGISVRQGTHAVHTLGYYRNRYTLDAWDCPRSYIADRLSITLPLYAQITSAEQERVVDAMQRLHDRT